MTHLFPSSFPPLHFSLALALIVYVSLSLPPLPPRPCLCLSDLPLCLVLIRQQALVGELPGNHKVYKITKIAVVELSEDEPQDLELEVS